MTRAQTRTASRKNAITSRSFEVRSCGAARREPDSESLVRPLRRSRRAIDTSLRLIESASRAMDSAERVAAGRPIHASRQFQAISGLLVKAGARLQHACRGMHATLERVALAPDRAADVPEQFVDTSLRFADAAALLAALSDRVEGASRHLLDAVQGGLVPFDPSELTVT